MNNENSAQPAEGKGPWWFVWILCAVIVPGSTFGLLATQSGGLEVLWGVIALVVFVLHIVASVKLGKNRSGWLIVGLIFGGWVLMLMSVFVGCLVLVSQGL